MRYGEISAGRFSRNLAWGHLPTLNLPTDSLIPLDGSGDAPDLGASPSLLCPKQTGL